MLRPSNKAVPEFSEFKKMVGFNPKTFAVLNETKPLREVTMTSARPPVKSLGTLKVILLGDTESTWAACPLIMTLTFPSSYERPLFGAFIVDVVKGVEA